MACFRTADAVGLVFVPLNVRALPVEKVAGGFLPVSLPNNKFISISDSNSNFHFDFAITGGVSWRRIS
jgi:hypothetical protein